MRIILGVVAALTLASVAEAQVHVRGHYRKDGTYVQPHVRSAPNGTAADNYSTLGNINPNTGQPGTKSADDYPVAAPNQTGPSATCRDGSVSYSTNPKGTCSSHGGVSQWR